MYFLDKENTAPAVIAAQTGRNRGLSLSYSDSQVAEVQRDISMAIAYVSIIFSYLLLIQSILCSPRQSIAGINITGRQERTPGLASPMKRTEKLEFRARSFIEFATLITMDLVRRISHGCIFPDCGELRVQEINKLVQCPLLTNEDIFVA
jgi:hypothetical protein